MEKLCECGCGKPAPIAKWNDRRYGHVKGQPVRFISGHNERLGSVQLPLPPNPGGACECGCGQLAPLAKETRRGYAKGQSRRFVHNHHWRGLHRARPANFRHGASRGTAEYAAYRDAKNRCTNPSNQAWPDYGGRGIRFLFDSYEAFIACLGPRPAGLSLDRSNNDSHYMPGNVRWATGSEQQHNKRPRKQRAA